MEKGLGSFLCRKKVSPYNERIIFKGGFIMKTFLGFTTGLLTGLIVGLGLMQWAHMPNENDSKEEA